MQIQEVIKTVNAMQADGVIATSCRRRGSGSKNNSSRHEF